MKLHAEHLRSWLVANIELQDILVFGGLMLASIGIAKMHVPAALIVAGAGLFSIGYFGIPPKTPSMPLPTKRTDAR